MTQPCRNRRLHNLIKSITECPLHGEQTAGLVEVVDSGDVRVGDMVEQHGGDERLVMRSFVDDLGQALVIGDQREVQVLDMTVPLVVHHIVQLLGAHEGHARHNTVLHALHGGERARILGMMVPFRQCCVNRD
ncbi:hypothetical protein ElyMa_000939800 [Elysia marginata]|uniref:ATPase F1/V1/A1 complex alpha/beta subunit N-terminal domain-containing protein n=1 Tax=Elysia marginata TaxID=1093978 RepID=A0AAV4HBT8_9GAST|nr:hypothetical protein ElyMa_000939800 [Elysia marginata]